MLSDLPKRKYCLQTDKKCQVWGDILTPILQVIDPLLMYYIIAVSLYL